MIERKKEKAKKGNKKVCIYAHKFPDGDAISSASAIVEYLKSQGVEANYIITNPVNSYTQVVGTIPTTKSIDENTISLIVDTGTLDYVENRLFSKTAPEDTFVIDHHIKAKGMSCIEDELGLPEENVLRDSSASSTCEILVNEFERGKISPRIANMLTLGLMTDTAKLKFLKPNTLQNLKTLLENGADYESIVSMCTRKSNLRDEVGMSKIFLDSQRVDIGHTFGIILPVDNKTITSMNSQYGLRSIQKKIFKMSDITNCSFNCMFAENVPGEFDLEFRSSSVYGNFDVQQLAIMYGGGGHYNASGCHLSQKNGYNSEVILSAINQHVLDMYAEQATGLEAITLTDTDKELATILDETDRLTKGVSTSILDKVDELKRNGANYDYTFKTFKTFERFMLENEILSRIPSSVCSQRQPVVNISLSTQDINSLSQKYNVGEDELLGLIDIFLNINIQSASISLPNGRKTTIDRNGNITSEKPNIKEKREVRWVYKADNGQTKLKIFKGRYKSTLKYFYKFSITYWKLILSNIK